MRYLFLALLLVAGCSRQAVTPPNAPIQVPNRPTNPKTVDEWRQAVDADESLTESDKEGLDKAQESQIRAWLIWITSCAGVLAGLSWLSRFYPPAAGWQWLAAPVAHYGGIVAAAAFACLWLIPYRYWIGGILAALILGYQVLRVLFRNSKLFRVASALSGVLDACKAGTYKNGDTAQALADAGADLKLAASLRKPAAGKG